MFGLVKEPFDQLRARSRYRQAQQRERPPRYDQQLTAERFFNRETPNVWSARTPIRWRIIPVFNVGRFFDQRR
jgi:hypothetical protein